MKKWTGLLILVIIAIGGAVAGVYYFQSQNKSGKIEMAQQDGKSQKSPEKTTQPDKPKTVKPAYEAGSFYSNIKKNIKQKKQYLQKKQNDFYERYHKLLHNRRNFLIERMIQKLKEE